MKISNKIGFIVILVSTIITGCLQKERFDLKFTLEAPQTFNPRSAGEWDDIPAAITARLKSFGLKEERFSITVDKPKFIVEIKGTDTTGFKVLKGLLTVPGKIEFWETYENREIFDLLLESDEELKLKILESSLKQKDTIPSAIIDPALIPTLDSVSGSISVVDEIRQKIPLYNMVYPNVSSYGIPLQSCLIGYADAGDTSKINAYLKSDEALAMFPGRLVFCWSRNPWPYGDTKSLYELHALRPKEGYPDYAFDGSVIVKSKLTGDRNSFSTSIDMEMNLEGARLFSVLTAENLNRCIAVVMDGYVLIYPRVVSEIKDGKAQITFGSDFTEARILSCILNSFRGVMPVRLQITDIQLNKI